jgi:hypothetical protein
VSFDVFFQSFIAGDASKIGGAQMGSDPWELLVKGAQVANWVIMPVGRPTCRPRQPHPRP